MNNNKYSQKYSKIIKNNKIIKINCPPSGSVMADGHQEVFADRVRSPGIDTQRNQSPEPTGSAVLTLLPHLLAITEWSTETTKY